MKEFIKDCKVAWNDPHIYDRSPSTIKIFLAFVFVIWGLYKILYHVVLFITVPLWIVPNAIFYSKKKRGENK